MGISSSEKYKKSKLLLLPDYLLTNKIFPFLSDKELFLTLRKVHPYLNIVIKSSLGENYLEEIKYLPILHFIFGKTFLKNQV